MNISELRGHPIEFVNGEWLYSDTKQPTITNWDKRPCGFCNKYNTVDGHDGCLGELDNVINACCGHGNVDETYVQFSNKLILRGNKAINYFNRVIWEGGLMCE